MSCRRCNGFTLIEILVAVAIFGVMSMLAWGALGESLSAADMLSENYVDDSFSTGSKHGYRFFYIRNATQFVWFANPLVHHETGHRYFSVGISGVIWVNPNEAALPFRSTPLD